MAQTIIARRVLSPSSPCAQRRNPCGALGLDRKSTAKQGDHHAMNADTGPLGKQQSEALAKNLLTGEASYKCPSSSAVARHFDGEPNVVDFLRPRDEAVLVGA